MSIINRKFLLMNIANLKSKNPAKHKDGIDKLACYFNRDKS